MVQRASGFSLFFFTIWFIVLIIEWATISQFSQADQVIADDLIVQSSICAGFDCVNNESFGFDTIRLKENNTRIGFDDTSATAGFPANDWQITANDSASGGANKFSIDDITGAKTPFTIIAGAPTSSLDISVNGNVGIGTAAPTSKLTVHGGSSDATIHLTQTGTVGNTWEVKNNAATGRLTFGVSGAANVPFKMASSAADNLLRVGVVASNRVDINGNLVVTGAITPDYVFTSEYKLESIKEHAKFMWRERHLPAVGPGQVNESGAALIASERLR